MLTVTAHLTLGFFSILSLSCSYNNSNNRGHFASVSAFHGARGSNGSVSDRRGIVGSRPEAAGHPCPLGRRSGGFALKPARRSIRTNRPLLPHIQRRAPDRNRRSTDSQARDGCDGGLLVIPTANPGPKPRGVAIDVLGRHTSTRCMAQINPSESPAQSATYGSGPGSPGGPAASCARMFS